VLKENLEKKEGRGRTDLEEVNESAIPLSWVDAFVHGPRRACTWHTSFSFGSIFALLFDCLLMF